jgi:hypothetical protein
MAGAVLQSEQSWAARPGQPLLRRAKRGLAVIATTSRLAINSAVMGYGLWLRRNIAGLLLLLL